MRHSMANQMLTSTGVAENSASAPDRAAALYARARDRGQRSGLGFLLNGRSRCLLTLDGVHAGDDLCARPGLGIQTVPLAHIRGSESRSGDFDRDFNPLQDHNRQRWLSVAVAREQGKALPPVDLIQVGEIYFVRDGHHRISVARALGQRTIEARVLVWQVAGPLPWEAPATGQQIGLGRLLDRVQDGAARLRENVSNAVEVGLKTAVASLTAVVGG